jgi:RND family efflux transporter MFP subunit
MTGVFEKAAGPTMDSERLAQLSIQRRQMPTSGPRRWRKRVAIALLIGALAALFWTLYWQGFLTPAVKVRLSAIALIYPSQVITEINASGYVVAQSKAAVASKGTGRLAYLAVREGSVVHKGEVIARLEDDDLQADLAQARAQLAASRASLAQAESELRTAENNWERFLAMWDRRLIAKAEYENALDRYQKAKAAVDSGRANIKALEAAVERAAVLIEFTHIRAPFDGVILTKNADVGEVVAPFGSATNAKAAVVTMADFSSLMVEADVAEAFLPKVTISQPCEIQLDALPKNRFPGVVDTIVPTADRTKGTVLVKVRFNHLDPGILPEMSARVAFLSRPLRGQEKEPVLAVHREALTRRNGSDGIFLVKEGHAVWVPLGSVSFMGDFVILAPPLEPGEQAVLKPAPQLKDGAKIKVSD